MLHTDFHTHTTFCDGKSTPREMVEAAYRMGMTDFGVSGHADFSMFEPGFGMDDEKLRQYTEELQEHPFCTHPVTVKFSAKLIPTSPASFISMMPDSGEPKYSTSPRPSMASSNSCASSSAFSESCRDSFIPAIVSA